MIFLIFDIKLNYAILEQKIFEKINLMDPTPLRFFDEKFLTKKFSIYSHFSSGHQRYRPQTTKTYGDSGFVTSLCDVYACVNEGGLNDGKPPFS